MSTKIYDAYRFTKSYNMKQMMPILDQWRTDITNKATEEYAKLFLRHFTYWCDLITVYGDDKIDEIIEKNKNGKYKDDRYLEILAAAHNRDISSLKIAIDNWLDGLMHKSDRNVIANMFKCDLYIYPISRKILFMAFGNMDFIDYIAMQDVVQDYHYQNQTDKPDDISESSWQKRYEDWEEAIGPDFVPSNHGLSISLVKSNLAEFSIFNSHLRTKNISSELLPTLNDRIKTMLELDDSYPDPPTNAMYSEWMDYMKTDRYLDWEKKKKEDIKVKLELINVKDIYVNNKM
jgi:hypothetical protein